MYFGSSTVFVCRVSTATGHQNIFSFKRKHFAVTTGAYQGRIKSVLSRLWRCERIEPPLAAQYARSVTFITVCCQGNSMLHVHVCTSTCVLVLGLRRFIPWHQSACSPWRISSNNTVYGPWRVTEYVQAQI